MAMGCNSMLFQLFIGNAQSQLQWFIRCHKSIFWLRSSWLTGVSQPWPWLRNPSESWRAVHYTSNDSYCKNTELLSRESWIRLLHRGDSLDMFETEFKLWQDLCSPKQWPLGMLRWKSGLQVLEKHLNAPDKCVFSVWDTSGAELSRPGPIRGPFWEHKTLNLNSPVATPCVLSSLPAGNRIGSYNICLRCWDDQAGLLVITRVMSLVLERLQRGSLQTSFGSKAQRRSSQGPCGVNFVALGKWACFSDKPQSERGEN